MRSGTKAKRLGKVHWATSKANAKMMKTGFTRRSDQPFLPITIQANHEWIKTNTNTNQHAGLTYYQSLNGGLPEFLI